MKASADELVGKPSTNIGTGTGTVLVSTSTRFDPKAAISIKEANTLWGSKAVLTTPPDRCSRDTGAGDTATIGSNQRRRTRSPSAGGDSEQRGECLARELPRDPTEDQPVVGISREL